MDELTSAWAHGRALSRGPEVAARRHVLAPGDWLAAARLGRELTTPGTEIKLVGPTSRLREVLPPEWSMYPANHLMTVSLATGAVDVPVEVVAEGEVLEATVRDRDGAVVSRARMAASGRYGVFDRVRTRAADQRRGLGRAVMTALVNRALDDGLTMGVLSATDDGRGLYLAVGWAVHGEMAGAYRC